MLTSPRTIGPVSAASPYASALSSAACEQRAQRVGGLVGAGRGQHLQRLADQGDQVVGAVREAGVVERAAVLGHPHRAAAEVGDERLGERLLGVAGGDAEDAAGEPVEVEVGAGEGHRGVQRDRAGTGGGRGGEHVEPVPARGVHDVLAGADRAAGGEHLDDVAEHVVGDGQQQHVAGAGDGARLERGYAGQQRLDAGAGGTGLTGGGDDLVAGRAEGGGQDGTDASGADDADAMGVRAAGVRVTGVLRGLRHAASAFRSSPADHPRRGPVWVPDGVLDSWSRSSVRAPNPRGNCPIGGLRHTRRVSGGRRRGRAPGPRPCTARARCSPRSAAPRSRARPGRSRKASAFWKRR